MNLKAVYLLWNSLGQFVCEVTWCQDCCGTTNRVGHRLRNVTDSGNVEFYLTLSKKQFFFFFSLDPSHILSNTDFMCSFCLNQSGYTIHTVCIECVFLFTTILSPHMRFSSSLFVALIIHTWHNWGQNVFCHSNNTQREILCFFSTTFIWLSYFQILFSNTICNIINEITYRVVHKLPIWMWWHA